MMILVLAVYWPGFGGSFILDDTPNLNILQQLPEQPTWENMWYLAQSGSAGILGRPLSLFSFLLQHESWPDPYNFKLVNVLLHLFNGFLVAFACFLICKCRDRENSRDWAIICLVSFIWLAHPIQVSAVTYVVQRMTLLSTTFMLMGIIAYLWGRRILSGQFRISALLLMVSGPLIFGPLAIFSKENGVLIFLYLAVLELTLFSHQPVNRTIQLTRHTVLYLPLCLGIAGFLLYLPVAMEGYALKPFEFDQRTLSQFPVLLTYIASICLLLPGYFGVFHDDFPLPDNPLLSVQVWLGLVIVVSLIVMAIVQRKRWPWVAFAILWFFAGHALESTVLPLELYFEHRNYLPLLGPVLAGVMMTQYKVQQLTVRPRIAAQLTGLAVLIIMTGITFYQNQLWGNPLALAYANVEHHPDSNRAKGYLVQMLTASNRPEEALEVHLSSISPDDSSITPYIRWLEFSCILPNIELPEDALLGSKASNAPHDFSTIFLLNNLTFGIIQNRCASTPREQVRLVLNLLAVNPAYQVSKADLVQMQAFLAAGDGEFGQAAALASDSYELRQDARVLLYRVTWLLRDGQNELAGRELQFVVENYGDAISSSAELNARYQYLQGELK